MTPNRQLTMHTGLILGLRPANERLRYKVTPFLIGWAHSHSALSIRTLKWSLCLDWDGGESVDDVLTHSSSEIISMCDFATHSIHSYLEYFPLTIAPAKCNMTPIISQPSVIVAWSGTILPTQERIIADVTDSFELHPGPKLLTSQDTIWRHQRERNCAHLRE